MKNTKFKINKDTRYSGDLTNGKTTSGIHPVKQKTYFDMETNKLYQDQSKSRLERQPVNVEIINIMDTISDEVKMVIDRKFEEVEAFYEFIKLQEVFKNQKNFGK